MKIKVVVVVLSIIGLCGCYSRHIPSRMTSRTITSRVVKDEQAVTIYRDKKSKSDYLQIDKVINSSCFCADAIAEMYVNNRIVYRLYYGCSIYKTRKEMFSYCSQGGLFGPRLFDGTAESGTDYETRLDTIDKFVLHKIDSFIQTESEKLGRFKLCEKNIRGFSRVEF